ncbi:MAG: iron-containing alcohol dehydrogenase, partial [Bacteroidales bacterium]|nr:iron-containing alcohol dehydrogenase [Bacteroidales bacterium]
AFAIVHDGLQDALSDPAGVRSKDVGKIEQLAKGLVFSGFAMQAYRSSRPASGAEHIFNHLWDMEGLTVDGHTNSHGFQVAIGTLASTALYEQLLKEPVEDLDVEACVAAWKPWEETERDIREIFGGEEKFVSRGLTETRAKYVDKDGLRSQLEGFKAAWPALKRRLESLLIPCDEVRERLRLAGAPYEPEQIGLTREHLLDSYRKLPYMRTRFTVIDVAVRCRRLDRWLAALFASRASVL